MRRRKLVVWSLVVTAATVAVAVLVYRSTRIERISLITGAVLEADRDPKRQQPVATVQITAQFGASISTARSDASGLFRLPLRPAVYAGDLIKVSFLHPNYEVYETSMPAERLIHVIRLTPKSREPVPSSKRPPMAISDIRVRYAMKSTAVTNVGSTVKTFEVINTGNVPCNRKGPCSPDGRWKAEVGVLSLDAGDEKEFRNARVSCIAGPCPFTRIDSDGYSRGGRNIKVSVRNWSDTVTFLLEAEVTHTMVSDMIRHSFPAIFDRSMNFTLPASAQGPSIEAEINGSEIVFPLGPALKLSWANCSMEVGADRTKLYRCELKPEYEFK